MTKKEIKFLVKLNLVNVALLPVATLMTLNNYSRLVRGKYTFSDLMKANIDDTLTVFKLALDWAEEK